MLLRYKALSIACSCVVSYKGVPLEVIGAVVIAKLFAVTLDENLAAPVALNVPLTSNLKFM
jgi:hypothetical protein